MPNIVLRKGNGMGYNYDQLILEEEKFVKEWFHHLHENPELGFEEVQTSKFVVEHLERFPGIEVKRIGKTGVLGILHTEKPGPVIAFRADMDALPIQETNEHQIKSKNPGIMHACAHDAHTATLLGVAEICTKIKDDLCGELRFVFQPSEEIQPGGAKSMVEGGAIEGVDHIFGLHYSIDEDPGCFSIQSGNSFAANYVFQIQINGKEGHAAFPYLVQDVILTAAKVIEGFQSIVSRSIRPVSAAVISVTKIQGGEAFNSLPAHVDLGGTIRFLDPECKEVLFRRMEEILSGTCSAYGCTYEMEVTEGCTVLQNPKEVVEKAGKLLAAKYGKEKIFEHEPVMGCEDFSEYLKEKQGAFYRVGCKYVEEDGSVFPTHNGGFRLDERALTYGMGSALEILLGFLKEDEANEVHEDR